MTLSEVKTLRKSSYRTALLKTVLQNQPREKHARGEKARLSLWTCMGASLDSDCLPQVNSSAENQARRAEVHAWISRICASLPPKLIDPLLLARFRAAGDFFSGYQ